MDSQQTQQAPQKEKKPWVKPLLFILGLVGCIVVLANTVDYFSFRAAKGDLLKAHQGVPDCHICHEPMQEVRAINCARAQCHTGPSFRKKHPETASMLVQHIMHKDCIVCHTEHKGSDAKLDKPFTHPSQDSKCGECHMTPEKHQEYKGDKDCGACHKVASFKASAVAGSK